MIVLDGAGTLRTEGGDALHVARGDDVLVPWTPGSRSWPGELAAVVCRPPIPTGGQAEQAGARCSRRATSSRASAACRRCAARASPCTRARSSRWSATTAPARARSSRRSSGVHPPDSGQILFEGRPVTIPTPHRRARARDRDGLPGPRARARARPRGEHVPRARDPRPGLLGKLGFLDKAGDAAPQRRGVHATSACGSRTSSAPVANMSGGQRQGVAVCRAVTWAEQGRVHGRADRGARRRADAQGARADPARARQGVSVVLISHNMPEVLEVADRIEVLRLGRRVARLRPQDARWRNRRRDDRRATPRGGDGMSAEPSAPPRSALDARLPRWWQRLRRRLERPGSG